jgi:GNAT superfamily N-acetyltransferase
MPGSQIPAPEVTVRPARADDVAAAELVFEAAALEYARLAGSPERARRIVARLWPRRDHSASFEHALVAERDGRVVGVLVGFPARDRYRLHRRLLLAALPHLSPRRWPLLVAGTAHLVLASPHPPSDSFYVQTIAVAWHARWHGVGSTLGHYSEVAAAERGFRQIVAHTGTRHAVARRALENYGLRLKRARPNGYALYVKPVDPRA